MFKVGDEVFIKAEITDVHPGSERPYFVHPNLDSVNWVSKNTLYRSDGNYEQGLADSWNLLKKVYDMTCNAIEEIFDVEGGFWDVIRDFTYEEALAKIEAYEKEKEIKVGDVVHHMGGKTFIVTYIHDDGHVSGITEEGGIYSRVGIGNVVKAGKHIDIESLLKEIGE